jgi:hypothetical protein
MLACIESDTTPIHRSVCCLFLKRSQQREGVVGVEENSGCVSEGKRVGGLGGGGGEGEGGGINVQRCQHTHTHTNVQTRDERERKRERGRERGNRVLSSVCQGAGFFCLFEAKRKKGKSKCASGTQGMCVGGFICASTVHKVCRIAPLDEREKGEIKRSRRRENNSGGKKSGCRLLDRNGGQGSSEGKHARSRERKG